VRTSLLSALGVLVGLLAPCFVSPEGAYVRCLAAHGRWTASATLLWFVVLRQLGRLVLRAFVRGAGGRLLAGDGR